MATAVLAASASAQDRRDGYRVGAFVAAPEVTVATGYDSNLFRTATRPTGTLKVKLAPGLTVASGWSRHAAKLVLGAEAGFFADSSDDNYVDAKARLAGELDVTRRLRLSVDISAARDHDPRGADDLPALAAEPAVFTTLEIGIGAEAEVGRLRLAPFATFRRLDFSDVALTGGGTGDQDARDRRELEAGLEVGFSTGRAWEVFARASVFDIAYHAPGPARDAGGFTALGGVRLKLTDLLDGRIAAGVTRHDYDSPVFADVTALAVDTALTWRPTRRLTFGLEASRDVAETAVAGASGRVATAAGFSVGYELLRTLSIGADAAVTLGRYRGIARRDTAFAFGLGAGWSPARGLSVRPEYRFERRISNTAGEGFIDHSISFSATLEFGVQ